AGQAGVGQRLGGRGGFWQGGVGGVDGGGPALARCLDDVADVEVALRWRGFADVVRLVGEAEVEGVAVDLGVDGNRGDAEFLAGAEDPDRNLATVGDKEPADGGHGRILTTQVPQE